MRARLTDAEREARRRENVARVLAGRPNPSGQVGGESIWRKLAEAVLSEIGGLVAPEVATRTGDPDLDMFGLTRTCSFDDVKKAYRRLMKEVHPDLGGKDVELAKAANVAYERLKRRFEV